MSLTNGPAPAVGTVDLTGLRHFRDGTITVVSAEEGLFFCLYTPSVGVNPQQAVAPYPTGDLSFLDGVPRIGNKFHAVGQLGPESAPNVAAGNYHRSLYFHFS